MKNITIITFLVLSVLSCRKPKTKTEILIKNTWKQVSYVAKFVESDTIIDLLSLESECIKNTEYKFNEYTFSDGCKLTEDRWYFKENETKMKIWGDFIRTATYDIIEFTNDRFVLQTKPFKNEGVIIEKIFEAQ